MGSCIEHKGIVQERDNERIVVKIEQTSACAACHARGMCSSADVAEKLIEIAHDLPKEVAVGETVTIQGETSIGHFAVRVAFVYPFLVLFATLVITYYLTYNEMLAGILAIAVLLPYYFVLYLARPILKKKLVFTIKK